MDNLNKYKSSNPEIKKLKEARKMESKNTYHESPYTMEDGTATFFYIVTMVIGTLFIDRWLIYIAATFIYLRFKNRHEKKK